MAVIRWCLLLGSAEHDNEFLIYFDDSCESTALGRELDQTSLINETSVFEEST